MEFKNKEEILEHMTREMQIRGLISKEGSKSVFKREENVDDRTGQYGSNTACNVK